MVACVLSLVYRQMASLSEGLRTLQLQQLPVGGLLVFDLSFFKLGGFDQLTQSQKFLIAQLRKETAYKVIRTLGCGLYFRDEIELMKHVRATFCI